MKKYLIMLFLLLALAIPLSCIGGEAATLNTGEIIAEEAPESNYFREKIMPFIVANISSICSAVLVIFITINKIRSATSELKISNTENKKIKEANRQLQEEVVALKEEVEKITQEFNSIHKSVDATKEMIRIGFCNTEELVKNGYAQEIAKVGKNEKKDK